MPLMVTAGNRCSDGSMAFSIEAGKTQARDVESLAPLGILRADETAGAGLDVHHEIGAERVDVIESKAGRFVPEEGAERGIVDSEKVGIDDVVVAEVGAEHHAVLLADDVIELIEMGMVLNQAPPVRAIQIIASIRCARLVGQRVVAQDIPGDGADPAGRNHVSGEWADSCNGRRRWGPVRVNGS